MTSGDVGSMPMDVEAAKRSAGERAATLVTDGMTLGLGTGSTARWFIDAVGRRRAAGLAVRGVATSAASAQQAAALGIPIVELDETGVDLAVDGADRVDPDLNLVKGFGGALLREKIVAAAARRFVVVVDAGKLRQSLAGRVPVEVARFGCRATAALVQRSTGAGGELRRGPDGAAVVTDNGNHILDLEVPVLTSPHVFVALLESIPGVLGHGLFLGMVERVIVAGTEGSIREMVAA